MEQTQGLNARQDEYLRLLLIGLMFVLMPAVSTSQQSKPSEYQVKATYLYNFSRFVEWPPQTTQVSSDHFLICVLGDDPFGSTLTDIVANENVDGKTVLAKRVLKPDEATGCRVLFISYSEGSRLKYILASLDHSSVLTVSDLPQFTQRGGMIQFVVEHNHVRFQVNVTTAKRAGLVMSSELLKLAVGVEDTSALGN